MVDASILPLENSPCDQESRDFYIHYNYEELNNALIRKRRQLSSSRKHMYV